MLLAKLAKKPSLQTPSPTFKDPFLPPFEEGLFINELSETHSLLFNKFQVCKEHVLVVTT
jgi:ATP adenylyltransferase